MNNKLKDAAIFDFQDSLSKFCVRDKTERPNGFELIMYELGYQKAIKLLNEGWDDNEEYRMAGEAAAWLEQQMENEE